MDSDQKERVNITEFARLMGVTQPAVSRAIASGRLKNSITKLPNGKYEIDVRLGAEEFDQKRRGATNGQNVDLSDVAENERKLKHYQAELARIKFEKEAGLLIPAEKTRQRWIASVTVTKTKVLGIPSKLRQRIPELTPEQHSVIEMIVRETLEDLRDNGPREVLELVKEASDVDDAD